MRNELRTETLTLYVFVFPSMVKLSKAEAKLLHALLNGWTLKSHRYLDGTKLYQLHPLAGPAEPAPKQVVESLQAQGLIYSNQKFPAATYSLTEQGRKLAGLQRSRHEPGAHHRQ